MIFDQLSNAVFDWKQTQKGTELFEQLEEKYSFHIFLHLVSTRLYLITDDHNRWTANGAWLEAFSKSRIFTGYAIIDQHILM